MEALNNATRGGDFNRALVFAGEEVARINEILPVTEIFRRLHDEIRLAKSGR